MLAATLDQLVFGRSDSETAHQLAASFLAPQATAGAVPSDPSTGAASDVVTGVAGLTARRMLPRTPNPDYYGGQLQFKMTVHPNLVNYFTMKTFGTDTSSSWMVLTVDGKEIGARHDGPDERMFHQENGWYRGGFIYRTARLPFHLTRGKTSVTVTLRSLGWLGYYSGATTYDGYQTRMSQATVPVYGVYTHTGPQLNVSGEAQGALATSTKTLSEDAEAKITSLKAGLNNTINTLLAKSAQDLSPVQMQLLAQSYAVSWSSGYQNAAVVSKVRDAMDAKAAGFATTTSYVSGFGNDSWGGYLGEAGDAVRLLIDPLGSQLETTVAYGGTLGSMSRRVAWATALRAGVDYGRTNRQAVTNQAFWNAWRVYLGNRALLALYPTYALREAEAMRYLKESAGVLPWSGNDAAGTPITSPIPTPGNAPFGPNWYMVTADGTTKEDCLVGADYGELGGIVMRWAVETGDAELRAKAVSMIRARAALRYPMPDASDNANMVLVDQIGCRNSHQIGGHLGYLGNAGSVDDLMAASLGSSVVGPEIVGYAQQAASEGRLMSAFGASGLSGWNNGLRIPEYYAAFKALPATGKKLPMSAGEPDFVWADRQNMVIAAKRGEERFWVNLVWRNPGAINQLARVSLMAPGYTMLAEVNVDDVQFTPAGAYTVRDSRVESDSRFQPPDAPGGVNGGLTLPQARRADLTSTPATNRDAGRGDAYTLRYGAWMIGLNAHPTRSYTMPTPSGYTGIDVATGASVSGALSLAPNSYKVIYLTNDSAIQAIRPAAPVMPAAASVSGGITIGWEATPGAASYSLSRATSADGPFDVITTGITGVSYTDVRTDTGTVYYYRVQAINSGGAVSSYSPVVSAKASAPSGLGAGWSSSDVGLPLSVGNTTATATGLALALTGGEVWGTADSMRIAYKVLQGDGSVTVRLTDIVAPNTWARSGIMVRESLDQGSRHVGLFVSKGGRLQVIVRRGQGWSSATPADGANTGGLPVWLRLTRTGQRFAAYTSADGSNWTPLTWTSNTSTAWTEEIAMPPQVLVGVVTYGMNASSTATFDNITLP